MLLELLATERESVNKLLMRLENSSVRIATEELTRVFLWKKRQRADGFPEKESAGKNCCVHRCLA